MAYNYAGSASSSPTQSFFGLSNPYDSTSDSSSPRSPTLLMKNTHPAYDTMHFATSQGYYSCQHVRHPDEYTSSSNLDDGDRRRKRNSSSLKEKDNVPNMHLQRRRAQNRASQRAFRERKEKHVKGLERQLDDLRDKHQDLLQSYSRQTGEVSKLNSRIHALTSELEMVRSAHDVTFSDLMSPDKFDAVPGSELLYSGPEFYFDKGAMDLNAGFSRHHLDDSL